MPGQTANGWPYPLGTEPVRDGDNSIQQLALVNENRLRNLQVQGWAIGSSTDANAVVNIFWQAPFATPPAFSVMVYEPGNRAIVVIPISVDQNGVVIRLFDTGGNVYLTNASVQLYIVAIGARVGV